METEKANGQYGKAKPAVYVPRNGGLFYPCRAAREQGRRGGRRSIYSRTVRQRARPLRYDAINNRERRKTEHGVFYRQIPE